MGENGRDAGEGAEVWVCECIREYTIWQWLCRPCVLSERKVRNQFGGQVWSKILPRRRVDGDCARCQLNREIGEPDVSAHLRTQRANIWEPDRVTRYVDKKTKKLVERKVSE